MAEISDLFTVDEVSAKLKADRRVVYDLIKSGALAARKVGRAWRIDANSLGDYIAGGSLNKTEVGTMSVNDFIYDIKQENERNSIVAQMEEDRIKESYKKMVSEAISILETYRDKLPEIGIETKLSTNKENFIFTMTKGRLYVKIFNTENNNICFGFDLVSLRFKGERMALGFDRERHSRNIPGYISCDGWSEEAFHAAIQSNARYLNENDKR